ncbi:hypothetical protein AK85_02240 [Streptococcus pneumoniae B1598]|nr:hypothetical protein AK85_02240 [Streptococcus pneumoniae B1598]
MKFGSDFSWLWVAIIRIFTAPFYIVLWCINVVKSTIGMFIRFLMRCIHKNLSIMFSLGKLNR